MQSYSLPGILAFGFPKKIAYTGYKEEGCMLATISGNGKSIDFHFEKIKTAKL
jgi:hypothetical protein